MGIHILHNERDWETARAAEQAIVYKHSAACPISATTRVEIERFSEEHPDIPVHVVDVLAHRDLSYHIANDVGILHQSPQAILLADGAPAWYTSHYGIRAAALAYAACVQRHRDDPEATARECGSAVTHVPTVTIPRAALFVGLAGGTAVLLSIPGGAKVLFLAAAAYVIVHLVRGGRPAAG